MLKDKTLQYLLVIVLVYLLWVAIRESFEKSEFLNPLWVLINDVLAKYYVSLASFFTKTTYYPAIEFDSRNMFYDSGKVLYVGNHCIGIAPMFVYSGIIFLNKIPIKRKMFFWLIGIAGIIILNLFRIYTLGWLLFSSSKFFFDINHSFTYLAIIYGYIFLLIIWFTKKFELIKTV